MSSRLYAHPADLPLLLDFVRAIRSPERIAEYPSLVDLGELLPLPEIQQNTRLWFSPTGEMLAYAFVDTFDNLQCEFAASSVQPLGAEVVAWAVEIVKTRGATSLDASCAADNQPALAFLRAHGFLLQPEETWHYLRLLAQPIPAPLLPPGFKIRPLHGEAEAAAAAALHRAAFGTEHMTVEHRLAMMRTPEYAPELDLVAVAPDGQLAAYTMVSISAEENARTGRKNGYTDPVATHPAFQRRGLARALLLTGLQMLKARGMETARLGTASDNLGMQKAAESAGFALDYKTLWFQKPLP